LSVSISQVIGCEVCLRNDLDCVGWGVKLDSISNNFGKYEPVSKFYNQKIPKKTYGV